MPGHQHPLPHYWAGCFPQTSREYADCQAQSWEGNAPLAIACLQGGWVGLPLENQGALI